MTNKTIAVAKADLRKQVLARRDALSPATRAALSTRITQRLLQIDSLRAARTVAAYMSINSEFATDAFVEYVLAQGKTLVLPRVEQGTSRLTLHRVTDLQNDLEPGVWGIMEPRADSTTLVQLSMVDWMLVPGLAFTRQGDRLGYGAGYYDRLIAGITHRPALVAGAFGVQLVDDLPTLPYDCTVDTVVTEDAVFAS